MNRQGYLQGKLKNALVEIKATIKINFILSYTASYSTISNFDEKMNLTNLRLMFIFLTSTVCKRIFIDIYLYNIFHCNTFEFSKFNRLFDEQAETYLMSKSQLIRYGIQTDENVISKQYVFTP